MKNHLYIHHTAVVDEGCTIGNGTKVWHFCHIMTQAVIGENCNLGQNVFVASGARIGNNVKIQNNVSIYEGVICEDDVFLGPSMVFTNVINPRSEVVRKGSYATTLVKKGCTIGANATILCGITLGEYAFIAAGAVVTKDVKPFAQMVGNPAKHSGWRSRYGCKLVFNEHNMAMCPESNEWYRINNQQVAIVRST